MRITTCITLDMTSGKVLKHRWHEWDGPVAQCKKGRETQEKVADRQLGLAQENQAIQKEQLAKTEPLVEMQTPKATGELSPYAAASLEKQKRAIADTWRSAREVGLRTLASRGMGAAPAGAFSSIMNTAARGQAADEADAYASSMGATRGDLANAINARMGFQQVYDPSSAYLGASAAAARRSQMGSTLGDVGQGFATVGQMMSGPRIRVGG